MDASIMPWQMNGIQNQAKAASSSERIVCGVMVKITPGKQA